MDVNILGLIIMVIGLAILLSTGVHIYRYAIKDKLSLKWYRAHVYSGLIVYTAGVLICIYTSTATGYWGTTYNVLMTALTSTVWMSMIFSLRRAKDTLKAKEAMLKIMDEWREEDEKIR